MVMDIFTIHLRRNWYDMLSPQISPKTFITPYRWRKRNVGNDDNCDPKARKRQGGDSVAGSRACDPPARLCIDSTWREAFFGLLHPDWSSWGSAAPGRPVGKKKRQESGQIPWENPNDGWNLPGHALRLTVNLGLPLVPKSHMTYLHLGVLNCGMQSKSHPAGHKVAQ